MSEDRPATPEEMAAAIRWLDNAYGTGSGALIDAAPDLLAACQTILAHLVAHDAVRPPACGIEFPVSRDLLEAVIAKATAR